MAVECIRVKGPNPIPSMSATITAAPSPAPPQPPAVVENGDTEMGSTFEWVSEYETCDKLRAKNNRVSRKCPGMGERPNRMNTGALDLSYICPYTPNAPECDRKHSVVGREALRMATMMRMRAQEKSFRSFETNMSKMLERNELRQQAQCQRRSAECGAK